MSYQTDEKRGHPNFFFLKRGTNYYGESLNSNADDHTYFIAFIWKIIVAKSETGFRDY